MDRPNDLRQFFEKLDWTKSNTQLAAETGKHRSVIYIWRRRLGKGTQKHALLVRHSKLLLQAKHWQWASGVTAVAKHNKISRQWAYVIARKLWVRK